MEVARAKTCETDDDFEVRLQPWITFSCRYRKRTSSGMLARQSSARWICARCQRRPRLATRVTTRRGLATAQSAFSSFFPSRNQKHDDDLLKQVFDSESAWESFSKRPESYRSRKTGLFGIKQLDNPGGFERYAASTLAKCKRLVDRVCSYSTVEDYRGIVKDLDRLSDLICRVIDLCEFVRQAHPDEQMQNAATKAYTIMFQYMNVLNTTPELNLQLDKAMNNPSVTESWSEQEKQVAAILSKDFSNSAVDLPEKDRRRFVELSDSVSQVGSEFMDAIGPAEEYLRFNPRKIKGLDPMIVQPCVFFGEIRMRPGDLQSHHALRAAHDPDIRRKVYMANRTAAPTAIAKLEELLDLRSQLAKLSGFDSYGHMALSDKMAKTPEAVSKFLVALQERNKPRVSSELSDMLDLKKSEARKRHFPDEINAWDCDYYTARIQAPMAYRSRRDYLSSYFSLGSVMQGLSRLFDHLYGIRFVPRATAPGETWDPDVRRLDIIDSKEGHIGVLYCDLYRRLRVRSGRGPNPAHFTVRCSRRISEEEQHEALRSTETEATDTETLAQISNDGLSIGMRDASDGRYPMQLPTIALICDFEHQPGYPSQPPVRLDFREVRTLFHEMGHAIHSFCGRTTLQNVSGTRCATDFAELPSVLMEHFAGAPEVLSLFARHWETGKPLDPSAVKEYLDMERRTEGAEIEAQVLMSLLDQSYHTIHPGSSDSRIDSTKVYHDIWNQYSSVPEPAGTSWQGFFSHLVGYGASYYAYLFDRVIAGKIWHDVFQRTRNGAIDPAAGALFREQVLKWGGGRDGWQCIAGALRDRDGVLAEGKDGAMQIVGQWGLKS